MRVELRYLTSDGKRWIDVPMTPGQYFETREPNAEWEWDDVPLHLHAARYLDLPAARIDATDVRIWQSDDQLRLTMTETFWNEGRNVIIQRFEDEFALVIIQIFIGEPFSVWHTVRLNCESDGSLLLEHLQLFETAQGQVIGPSEVLSLPPDQAQRTHSQEFPRAEVVWNQGRSRIVYAGDPQQAELALLLSLGHPIDQEHWIRLVTHADAALLEHTVKTGGDSITIVRREQGHALS